MADDVTDPQGVSTADAAARGTVADWESSIAAELGDVAELSPGDVVDRYEIRERIGAGGMGVVYRARDDELGRDVALKFLRPELGGERRRGRFMREARSMAQLRHPNVVSIYDVGEHEGHTWLAMEYVQGSTLRALMDGPRDWSDVAGAFLAAGRGLVAAHEVGIVHRDFKPENVLVEEGGVARVADFGLSYTADDPDNGSAAPGEADAATRDARLTRTGSLLGTPRYMAPEQHQNERVTAAADQFAYCVTLYEALYGDPPFAGTTYAELAANVTAGEIRAPSRDDVPRWRREVLLRGLSVDPEQRFPSMKALLDALEDDPLVRRRRVALAALALAAVAGVAAFAVVRARAADDACAAAETALAEAWSADRAERVRAAITEGDPLRGVERASLVVDRLEDYAREWTAMRRASCEATHVNGAQSGAMLDKRTACLDERRAALGSLAEMLAEGDAQAIAKAEKLAARLPGLEPCADTETLGAVVPLPDDEETRAAVSVLVADIGANGMVRTAGNLEAARARADENVRRARELDYAPVLANALHQRGMIECNAGAYDACEQTLKDAAAAAATGRDDRIAAHAWITLVQSMGGEQQRPTRAREFLPVARAAVERAGDDPQLRFNLLVTELPLRATEPERALELAAEAEALLASNPAVANIPDLQLAHVLLLKANVLLNVQKWDEVEATLERVIELHGAALGASHPDISYPLEYLGTMYRMRGEPERAVSFYERGLELTVNALGAEHPRVAALEMRLSYAMSESGDAEQAMAHAQRALEVLRVASPNDAIGQAFAHIAIGLATDDERASIEQFTSAVEALEGAGEKGDALPNAYRNRAGEWSALGEWKKAIADFETAKALYEEQFGRDYGELIIVHVGLGRALVHEGKLAAAIDHLERGRELNPDGAFELPDQVARRYLGMALYDSGRDRRRGLELVRGVRAELDAEPDSGEDAHEIDAWLRERGLD